MSFEVISTTSSPTHEIQVVQPQHSAQHLGDPISVGENQNLSVSLIQSQIDPVYQLELNETLSEFNLLNPEIKSLKLEEIERKSGQIDSVSTDIRIGAVESELEFNFEDIQKETTLFSEGGFSFKMKKELQIRNLKPQIQPILGFKTSLNLFQEYPKTKSEKKEISLQQATRLGVPRKIKLNSPYLRSVKIDQSARINQGKEIDDYSKDVEDLRESLNSLRTSRFGTDNLTFSLEADLEDLEAKLEFPMFGVLSDELELKFKTNLPEVMVDGNNLRDEMKSTLSLKYGVDLNYATKIEMQSSYNIKTADYKIMLMAIIE